MKTAGYLFQLVSVTISTCKKEAGNKRKQFPQRGKSLPTGRISFPINLFPLISVKFSACRKKKEINNRERFPQDRKSISTKRNEKFV